MINFELDRLRDYIRTNYSYFNDPSKPVVDCVIDIMVYLSKTIDKNDNDFIDLHDNLLEIVDKMIVEE